MKPDERKLLDEIQKRSAHGSFVYVRRVVAELGMNEKRAAYICGKWTDRGWYNYGVNVLSGWLTDEGRSA
jgi:hypothetical protein